MIISTFLFNLFCGYFSCNVHFDEPETKLTSSSDINGFSSRNGFRRSLRYLDPIVRLKSGQIEGYFGRTMGGRKIFNFEGIPYAEPPVGYYRWKPPVPRRPWRGVLQTKKPSQDCLQINIGKVNQVYGNENCLFLNVYTPQIADGTEDDAIKYPVLVYLHGGSFTMGSGAEHGPAYFLDQDIVLVTLNYRLGVLGFMSTGDEVLPGNYGLKDQALALQWVRENILKFGGDPENIVLWGNSAGGASVHIHMMSNVTKDMFTKGVSQSGTAMNHWAVQPVYRMKQKTHKMAKAFGCPTLSSRKLVECLRKVNVNFLVAEQINLFEWFLFPPVQFGPVIEPEHETAFLTETPEEAYKNGHVAKKPWVATMTSCEGQTGRLVLELFFRYGSLLTNWNNVAQYYLDYAYIAEDPKKLTDTINKYYLGDTSPIDADGDIFSSIVTDRFFRFGVVKSLQAHYQLAPTYSYYFSFREGKYNLANFAAYDSKEWGPGHAEDDYYFFNSSSQHASYKQADIDYELSQVMTNMFANFFNTDEPFYFNETSGDVTHVWEPVNNSSHLRALQVDTEIKMIDVPDIERLKFWKSLNLKDTVPWTTL